MDNNVLFLPWLFCVLLLPLYIMDSFQIIEPSPALVPYVKNYWFLKNDTGIDSSQRIISTGFISLVFHRGDLLFSPSVNSFQPRSFICGHSSGYSDLSQTGKVDMICITFNPDGAKAFFPFPMDDLYNQTIAVDLLAFPDFKELEERLYYLETNEDCVSLIEQFLINRLSISKAYNFNRMSAVIDSINKGQYDVSTLSEVSCLSYKQFHRVFTEYIGSKPKDFLRTIRFQQALYLLQTHPDMNFTNLAYACDFYDQSHMIKEFKFFSGYTPIEYISVCNPYSDYFS